MNTTRWYVPAYVAPTGHTVPVGDETTWLPGAAKEAHELHRAGDPGDAEIFVAYRDQPTWERLPQDDYEAEMEREADRAGLT